MLQKPFTGERMGAPPPSRASIRSTEISSLLFLMSQSVTIIGIDPGSRNTGWGVVREVSGVLQLVDCGVSFMVGRVLGVKPDWAVDTGDALAAAICHLTHRRFERLVRLSGR